MVTKVYDGRDSNAIQADFPYRFNLDPNVKEEDAIRKLEFTGYIDRGGFSFMYLGKYYWRIGRRSNDWKCINVAIKEFFMSQGIYGQCMRHQDGIKVMPYKNEANIEHYKEKFDKESRLLQEVDHPNIVKVYDAFKANNTQYFVMEFINGMSLIEYVTTNGPFTSFEQLWKYFKPLCEGVKHIHEHHIIHRDISPNNIRVETEDNGKTIKRFVLIDFGGCKTFDLGKTELADKTKTQQFTFFYTPLELEAPEKYEEYFDGSKVKGIYRCSSDIYSLGAILFYLLTGDNPPEFRDILIKKGISFPENISPEVQAVITAAMQPKRENRPQTMDEFIRICEEAKPKVVNMVVKKEADATLRFEILNEFLKLRKDIKKTSSVYASLDNLRVEAINDNPEAQYHLGESYRLGLYGLPANYKEAYQWYLKSAESGYSHAQFVVGYYHYLGNKDFPKDLKTAATWIKKSAENGDKDAMGLLSIMYSKGEGVPRDDIESANWSKREVSERIKEKTGEKVHIEFKDRVFLFNETKKQAEKGNAFSQHNLGVMYYNGDGVAKDNSKALEWLKKAVAQGNKQAIETLRQVEGLIEEKKQDNNKHDEKTLPNRGSNDWGGFVNKCLKEASLFNETKKQAEKGNAVSQNNLGMMYYNGEGVTKDDSKALEWLRKAAAQGNKQAINNLRQVEGEKRKKIISIFLKYIGITIVILLALVIYEMFSGNLLYMMGNKLYVNGKYDIAEKCLLNSSEHGNAESNYLLGSMYMDGNRSMDGIDDLVKVTEWLKKAVDGGVSIAKEKYAKACDSLGGQYYIKNDSVQAFNYYKIAAELNNASGQNHLGILYALGFGTEKNYEEAVKWYQKAADQGYVWGMHNLGTQYRWGNGVPQDKQEAIKWFLKAAEHGHVESMIKLGDLYGTINVKESFKWYIKAAENGNTKAQYKAGRSYQNGYGVVKDYNIAFQWYKKAAENGDWESEKAIGDAYYYGEESVYSYTNYSLGFKKDWVEASKWYAREGVQHNIPVLIAPSEYIAERLGDMYKTGGYGLKTDLQKAKEWYKIAADKGSTSAKTKFEKMK